MKWNNLYAKFIRFDGENKIESIAKNEDDDRKVNLETENFFVASVWTFILFHQEKKSLYCWASELFFTIATDRRDCKS